MGPWKQASWFYSLSQNKTRAKSTICRSTQQLQRQSDLLQWRRQVNSSSRILLHSLSHTNFGFYELKWYCTWAWLDPFCFRQSSLVSIDFLLLFLSAWCGPSLSSFYLQLAQRELLDSAADKSVLRADASQAGALSGAKVVNDFFEDDLLWFHVNQAHWSLLANRRNSF